MAEFSEVYDEGLARGELLLQQCRTCRRHVMYPRHCCPFCHGADLGWTSASGEGTLHSFTVLRVGPPRGFEEDLPYALGVVKLTEGVQVLGRLHPDDSGGWDSHRCDAPVHFMSADAPAGRRPTPWFAIDKTTRS